MDLNGDIKFLESIGQFFNNSISIGNNGFVFFDVLLKNFFFLGKSVDILNKVSLNIFSLLEFFDEPIFIMQVFHAHI